MSSAFIVLLRNSNLDYIITRKSLKMGAINDDLIIASFIDTKMNKLRLIGSLDKSDSVTIWSTILDERAFQINARLLDINEFDETMKFFAECLRQSDFTISKISTAINNTQLNLIFTYPKTKQSITLELNENTDEKEKNSFLSKILVHIQKDNERLSNEVKTQQMRIDEVSKKRQTYTNNANRNSDNNLMIDYNQQKGNLTKRQGHIQKSLINPMAKRRKTTKGVTYDEDDDTD